MDLVRNFILSVLLLLICSSAVVFAQQTGIVEGKVINEENGKPLAGVNVIVQNTNKGATTNANGAFTISGVRSGGQTLIRRF